MPLTAPIIDDATIRRAAQVLRAGGLVALPTETVYGLAADAKNVTAVAKIFAVKRRPANHPLIVHLGHPEQICKWAIDVPDHAFRLAEAFWPGPLTIVLRKHSDVPSIISANQSTIGLRIPNHPIALRLLQEFAGGLAAPSANRFTKVSPTSAENVRADLGDDVDMILDGGSCEVGIESTIVDLTQSPPVLLRSGAISRDELEAILGTELSEHNRLQTLSPGQHHLHYSIDTPLVVVESTELLLTACQALESGKRVLILATLDLPDSSALPFPRSQWTWQQMPREATELARTVYQQLRLANDSGYDLIVMAKAMNEGIGIAINDRLLRAAHRTK